jgi:ADP-ribose pyrophosphatase
MKPKIISRQTVWKGKFLECQILRTDATTIDYEVFTRPRGVESVVILAFTPQNEVILAEEFRPALDSWAISLMGGVKENDATVMETGRRELLEESGYESNEMIEISADAGAVPPTPGICTERTHVVLALNCVKVGKGGGLEEEQENIRTHLVKAHELAEFLSRQHKEGKAIFTVHMSLGLLALHQPKIFKEIFEGLPKK